MAAVTDFISIRTGLDRAQEYLIEAKIATRLLGWRSFKTQVSRGCMHMRVRSPDGLWSIDYCPIDKDWVQARGWPRYTRDPIAAGEVAAVLIERGVISSASSLTPLEICQRAIHYLEET